jgi:hypothetical protein
MTLRCLLDGLLLPATLGAGFPPLVAQDGEESFGVEALEAGYYELVRATADEVIGLERTSYRLLRRADDFRCVQAVS